MDLIISLTCATSPDSLMAGSTRDAALLLGVLGAAGAIGGGEGALGRNAVGMATTSVPPNSCRTQVVISPIEIRRFSFDVLSRERRRIREEVGKLERSLLVRRPEKREATKQGGRET